MSILRVAEFSDFKGENVVLAATDRDGLRRLEDALTVAVENYPNPERFVYDGLTHQIIPGNRCTVHRDGPRVIWSLPQTKLLEILEKLRALIRSEFPCHEYVDIDDAKPTLVLSVDEYVETSLINDMK